MQRILDLLLSGMALIILSPLMLIVMIVLRLTGEGEVFYLQERVGKNGTIFRLYKFATMQKNSPNIGTGYVTMKDDPRILPVGKYLRKTKINELPQLINIFLGDMSVVGPRPQSIRCFNAFPKEIQNSIVKVKPGLSGIGSIVFRREEDMLAGQTGSLEYYDRVIAPYKGRLEEWYVNNQNLYTYFAVILVTLCVVIFPNSPIVWYVFRDLPIPPDDLKSALRYPY